MSPTSYQTAPPRSFILRSLSRRVKVSPRVPEARGNGQRLNSLALPSGFSVFLGILPM